MITVLHMVGSPTSDFFADLSRLYAAQCLDAVGDDPRWEPHIAYVNPSGQWQFPLSLDPDALRTAPLLTMAQARAHIEQMRPDVALPQLFCHAGMTDYRRLLDALDIPFIGNPADVMAVGASKPRTRTVVEAAGVRVAPAVVVGAGDRPDLSAIVLPAVVKPVDADNSDGISLVRDAAELPAAIDRALRHSGQALVERYIELGREVRCGVWARPDGLHVLPLEEYAVHTTTKPIRNAADKLARHDGVLTLVAKTADHAWIVPVEDPLTRIVGDAAKVAHRAMGCRHYSLFDFRVDPDGTPFLLEAGLYCSFAPSSVLATMAAAAGIGVRDLFAAAVDQVLSEVTR